jgi:DNA polymerase
MNADPTANELLKLLRDSNEYARFLSELGVETVALHGPETSETSTVSPSIPQVELAAPRNSKLESPPPSIPRREQFEPTIAVGAASDQRSQDSLFAEPQTLTQSRESMEDIWRDIGECTRCGLCEGRTQVVNTHGNHKARLMFVGEAPGADEDAQGKPFVGRAGQLLTKIIEAIGMKREDVLIGNVNRCRPPGNRQPTLEEAAICRPFLFREIAAIQPAVIVVMGNTALRNLLEVREGITRVRGKFQDFRGIKVMPTFHPAYLLRDPSKKRETWEDLKKVRDYLDSLPPRPQES